LPNLAPIALIGDNTPSASEISSFCNAIEIAATAERYCWALPLSASATVAAATVASAAAAANAAAYAANANAAAANAAANAAAANAAAANAAANDAAANANAGYCYD